MCPFDRIDVCCEMTCRQRLCQSPSAQRRGTLGCGVVSRADLPHGNPPLPRHEAAQATFCEADFFSGNANPPLAFYVTNGMHSHPCSQPLNTMLPASHDGDATSLPTITPPAASSAEPVQQPFRPRSFFIAANSDVVHCGNPRPSRKRPRRTVLHGMGCFGFARCSPPYLAEQTPLAVVPTAFDPRGDIARLSPCSLAKPATG